ncbi:MAG: hypothetical protein AAGB15_15330 [Pseudomonadota bacterium]
MTGLTAAIGLGASAIPTPAEAQTVCGKRDEIISQLEKKYGETRRSVGVQRGRGVVEVYASTETGSWTILVTDPRGMSCLMAAGEAYEFENVAKRTDTPT